MNDQFLTIKNLLFSKTAKDSSVIFFGNVISSVFGILFAIMAARLLGPSDWGVVAAVSNMIPILIAVGDFGLGASLFQYASGKWQTQDVKKTYLSVFTLRIISGFILTAVLILLASTFSKIVYASTNYFLGILTAFGFLLVSLLDFQIFSIESKQRWKVAATLIAGTNIIRVLGFILLYFLNLISVTSVLVVFTASAVLPLTFSFLFLPIGLRFTEWNTILRKFAAFSAWMAANKLISSFSSRIDILLLLQMMGSYEAGIYGAASRLAMGVPLILGSFATVLASRFASISDKRELRNFFYKSMGLSVIIALGLGLGVFTTPLVIELFGPAYEMSAYVLQGLFIAMIPFALSVPSVNILIYHYKKPEIITSLSIIQLLIMLFIAFKFIPEWGVMAPVYAIGISNLLNFAVTQFFALRYLR